MSACPSPRFWLSITASPPSMSFPRRSTSSTVANHPFRTSISNAILSRNRSISPPPSMAPRHTARPTSLSLPRQPTMTRSKTTLTPTRSRTSSISSSRSTLTPSWSSSRLSPSAIAAKGVRRFASSLFPAVYDYETQLELDNRILSELSTRTALNPHDREAFAMALIYSKQM